MYSRSVQSAFVLGYFVVIWAPIAISYFLVCVRSESEYIKCWFGSTVRMRRKKPHRFNMHIERHRHWDAEFDARYVSVATRLGHPWIHIYFVCSFPLYNLYVLSNLFIFTFCAMRSTSTVGSTLIIICTTPILYGDIISKTQ